jgi:hypothetical protein
MRFMMIQFPKVYENAKPGWVPDLKDIEKMRKYNEQLQKAGVLLALYGLTPPSTMSARVTFKSGKSKLNAPNLYVAMTRGSKLFDLCSKTTLLNPRRK